MKNKKKELISRNTFLKQIAVVGCVVLVSATSANSLANAQSVATSESEVYCDFIVGIGTSYPTVREHKMIWSGHVGGSLGAYAAMANGSSEFDTESEFDVDVDWIYTINRQYPGAAHFTFNSIIMSNTGSESGIATAKLGYPNSLDYSGGNLTELPSSYATTYCQGINGHDEKFIQPGCLLTVFGSGANFTFTEVLNYYGKAIKPMSVEDSPPGRRL
jgi:hypothetical protein